VDSKGSTALSFAVVGGKPDAIRFLLDKGLDPRAKNKEGGAAIDLALGGMSVEIFDALLSTTRVSLQLDGVPFQDALRQLFDKSGIRYKLAEISTAPVSLNIVDVPFTSALKTVLRASGIKPALTYSPGAGTILIARAHGPVQPVQSMNSDP